MSDRQRPVDVLLSVEVTEDRWVQLQAYARLLVRFNQRVNLISRQDEDAALLHVRHALWIARRSFPPGCTVVDWGTGGGLPLIPLAVLFPEVHFVGVDAVDKKVRAVRTMARRLGLENCTARHVRAERFSGKVHYSVSRATASLRNLWAWHSRVAHPYPTGAGNWSPGLICLKGGDLEEEIQALHEAFPQVTLETLPPLEEDGFFERKSVLHVSRETTSGS